MKSPCALTVGFALHQLLEASQYVETPRYAGDILATTVSAGRLAA
jgi:hypothetical protein